MPRLPIWIALLAAGLLFAGTADAFELVMFRRAGCPWCAAWDRDIGPSYAKTEIGRRTPIRQVELDRDAGAKLKLRSVVRFTPTFVLIDGDREIGRIEGYPGEDFFWNLLERLTSRAQAELGDEAAR